MGDDKKPSLSVVDGGRARGKRRAGRRRALDEDEQVTCWQCELDLKIATSSVIEITAAPRRSPAGKKRGGTPQWACVHCLARGKVTILIQ